MSFLDETSLFVEIILQTLNITPLKSWAFNFQNWPEWAFNFWNWPEIGGIFLKELPVNLHYNQGIKFSTVLVLSAILLLLVIILGELNFI